jgi:hypothetical protein
LYANSSHNEIVLIRSAKLQKIFDLSKFFENHKNKKHLLFDTHYMASNEPVTWQSGGV